MAENIISVRPASDFAELEQHPAQHQERQVHLDHRPAPQRPEDQEAGERERRQAKLLVARAAFRSVPPRP